ncbi:PREDICTED: protein RFT1 homolog isoform X1 [Amphimedon queenslandica]|uniref:Protein RFT1 homolog n=2 Tax=Amphimedon queenslandica TaxID=400682 RepID=A0AAN0IZ57_AMPQE|nr:PREDICTED: protein RFT1 homolog isoform X1 [Amphimedon queenslandica]|eukprot:XP_019849738.1 PREDICTED: protein RFT1 homolog isoform X1 [Amphimedon queenslandica]
MQCDVSAQIECQKYHKMAAPLDVAARAASFNVLLQVSLRVASFALNGFVLRYVHADLLGVVNLRLTLLYNTILFLSREPFRKAALSKTSTTRQWQYTFNLMWLPFLVGIVWSALLSLLWISPLLQQPDMPGDWIGVACFAISGLIELCVEPLWVLAQLTQHVSIKVIAEGIPQVFRCLIVAICIVFYPQYGILIFGIAQVLCSIGYLLVYFTYFFSVGGNQLPIDSISKIFPQKFLGKYQDQTLVNLSKSFFKQSLLKQFLTDGERYIMTILGLLTFAEQGVYDIVNNLGSLAARFIFLPIEESFYVYFSSVLVRGERPEKQTKDSITSSANVLSLLIKTVTLIALMIIAFGVNYSDLALDIYGGSILSQGIGPVLLKCYCVYVLFLALNGITECFMFAALSQDEVDRYNKNMLVFSLIFLSAAVVLIKLFGSPGFIIANCINMSARIIYSGKFITNYFRQSSHNPLSKAVPSLPVFISLIVSWIITAISMSTFCCSFGAIYRLIHIIIGSGCFLTVGVVITLVERELMTFFISRLPSRFQKLLTRNKTD